MKRIPEKIIDHSVSGAKFSLQYDAQYHMYYTVPKPHLSDLDRYYDSQDYISHTDSKRSFFERVYQFVKLFALSRKQNLVRKWLPKGIDLLDIGAGTGDFAVCCQNKNWNVQAVEPSNSAREKILTKGVAAVPSLKDINQKFDAITLWHVLEHVYDLDQYFKFFSSNLKVDGRLFIAVPNFECFDAAYYQEYWAAFDVPRHLYHFSRKSIATLAAQYDLEVCEVVPMKLDAFYVSLLSEKYKSGVMNFYKAIRIGLKSNFKAKSSGAYSSLTYVLRHKHH